MSERCRLCLKQEGHLMKIFNNNVDNDIHFNIMTCIGISIREDDGITNLICAQCFYNVKSFSELRSAAIKNDIRLKDELLEKKRNGTETKINNTISKEDIKEEQVILPSPPELIPKKIIKIMNRKEEKSINPFITQTNNVPAIQNEQQSITENQTTFMSQLDLEKKSPQQSLTSLEKSKIQRRSPKYHPSVNKIRKDYPQIKIPKKCIMWDLNPKVLVNRKTVEDWMCSQYSNKVWTVSACENTPLSLSLTRVTGDLNKPLVDFESRTCDSESVKSWAKSDSSYLSAYADHSDVNVEEDDDDDDDLSDTDYDPIRQVHITWSNKSRKRSNKYKERRAAAKRARRISSYSDTDSHINESEITSDNQSIKSSAINLTTLSNEADNEKSLDAMTQMINDFLPPKQNAAQSKCDKENSNNNKPNNEFDNRTLDNDSAPIADLLVPTSNADKAFICQTCSLVFDSLKLLKEHKKQHPKDNLRCQSCSQSFPLVEDLVKHNIAVHTNSNLKPTKSLKKTARKSTSKAQDYKSVLKTNLGNNKKIKPIDKVLNKSSEKKVTEKIIQDQKTKEEAFIEKIKKCLPIERKKENNTVSNQHRFKPVNAEKTKELTSVKEKIKEHIPPAENIPTQSTSTLPSLDNAIVLSDDESPSKSNNETATPVVQPPPATSTKLQQPTQSLSSSSDCSTTFPNIPNEDAYFAEEYLKHLQNNKDLNLIKKTNYSGNVVLNNVDKILERSYIPVELVPKLDGNNNNMTLRYVSATNRNKSRPKSTSYSWCSQNAVQPPKNQEVVNLIDDSSNVQQNQISSQISVIQRHTHPVPHQINMPVTSSSNSVVPAGYQVPATVVQNISNNQRLYFNGNVVLARNHFRQAMQTAVQSNTRSLPPVAPTNSYGKIVATQHQTFRTQPPSYESSVLANQQYCLQSILNSSSVTNTRSTPIATTSTTTQQSGCNQLVTTGNISNIENSNPLVLTNLEKSGPVQSVQGIQLSESYKNNFSNLLEHALTAQKTNSNSMLTNSQITSNQVVHAKNLNPPISDTQNNHNNLYQNSNANKEATTNLQNACLYQANNQQPNINVQNFLTIVSKQRPAIRIKPMSELIKANTATVDRNEIQNNYENAVTEYFSTFQSQIQPNNTDEYLQI